MCEQRGQGDLQTGKTAAPQHALRVGFGGDVFLVHEMQPVEPALVHAPEEILGDAVAAVGGELGVRVNGGAAGTSADYGYKHTDTRRSVYSPVLRNSLPELFEAFDFADPSFVVGKRSDSTVAPQALFMMNHPWVMEQSQSAARKLMGEKLADDRTRVARAYRLVLGRVPTDGEVTLALKFLPAESTASEAAKRVEAWGRFYQTLFASVDFRYLN